MRRWGHSGGSTGYASAVIPAITVSSVWVGNVSTGAATVKARSTDATAVTLRYATNSGLTGYNTVAGTEGNDDVWTFVIPGLSAGTRYYYGFAGSAVTGTFRTWPSGASSFSIAAASCAGHSGGEYRTGVVSNTPAFDRIVDRDPLLFLHMGDRGYPDISSDSDSAFRTNYNNNMAMARQLALHKAMAVDYHWDDHDFGPNDSHAGSASKPAAQTVYREHVPHWTLPDDEFIYHTYVIGRVRFIITDPRSGRSQDSATDNSSKTMWGATQKQWIKDTLLAATEPLIVLAVSCPWIGTGGSTWGAFSTERTEMATFFTDNNLDSRLFILSGDYHMVAGDDGTNSAGGIPTASFAPLDAGTGTGTTSGTWSEGKHVDEQQMYGTLDFDDDGSEINVTATAWECPDTSTESSVFSFVAGPYS